MDWPGAEEMAERLRAVLLPEVRQADDEDGQSIPPELQQAMQQMQRQMQAMQESGAQLQAENDELKRGQAVELKKLLIDAYAKETDRIKALGGAMSPEMVQQLVMQTLQEVAQRPDPLGPEQEPPPMQQPIQQEPASAGFSLPESPAAMPATGA
jgi:hypothetical protein